jgi:hypothetical protein
MGSRRRNLRGVAAMKPTSAMNTRTGVTDFAHQRPVLVAKDKTLTRTIAIRPSD